MENSGKQNPETGFKCPPERRRKFRRPQKTTPLIDFPNYTLAQLLEGAALASQEVVLVKPICIGSLSATTAASVCIAWRNRQTGQPAPGATQGSARRSAARSPHGAGAGRVTARNGIYSGNGLSVRVRTLNDAIMSFPFLIC
jgi:hypothetical protein